MTIQVVGSFYFINGVGCVISKKNPFQLSPKLVDTSTSSSLYETRIYTTFPEVALRAKLRQGTIEEDGSGFVYSLKRSWQSIKEIPNDVVDGYKARGDKSFDSTYDFINHGTFGGLDAIWLGSKDRLAKKSDSPADFFNYVTAGISGAIAGTVIGTVNPKEPFSKEHWLDSFGLATIGVGGGRVATPKSGSSVSKKFKDLDQVVDEGIRNGSGIGDIEKGWNLSLGGGNINGRKYSQHALERMAPDIPEVRAALSYRAAKKADELGFKPQTQEYSVFIKKYVDPRNIPPTVIEDAIKHTKKIPGNRPGTFIHETSDVKVIINGVGDVITVIPK